MTSPVPARDGLAQDWSPQGEAHLGTGARVVLLMSPATYRAGAFTEAGERIGLNLVRALDLPDALATQWHIELAMDFGDTGGSVARLVDLASGDRRKSLRAILAVDDRGAMIAAEASARLGLPHNDPDSALAARNKFVMRERLEAGGVPVPGYARYETTLDPATIADDIEYPCVVKPLLLSGSRGVIRADDPAGFVEAFNRTRRIIVATGSPGDVQCILVERFVPGVEVAVEGLLSGGSLRTLAIFDKPDPLDGPIFEETIYVTPSRLPADIQAAISRRTAESAAAIGLREGPVHAELRVDLERAEIWMIELAGRSIGGLCSSVLEFGAGMGLEELILRHAAGIPLGSTERSADAAGVMMIPIPNAGMFRCVDGIERAGMVAGITGIEITAPLNRPIVPLPEGESYLGFIFARAATPDQAEAALREAHGQLRFRIDPTIPLRPA